MEVRWWQPKSVRAPTLCKNTVAVEVEVEKQTTNIRAKTWKCSSFAQLHFQLKHYGERQAHSRNPMHTHSTRARIRAERENEGIWDENGYLNFFFQLLFADVSFECPLSVRVRQRFLRNVSVSSDVVRYFGSTTNLVRNFRSLFVSASKQLNRCQLNRLVSSECPKIKKRKNTQNLKTFQVDTVFPSLRQPATFNSL